MREIVSSATLTLALGDVLVVATTEIRMLDVENSVEPRAAIFVECHSRVGGR